MKPESVTVIIINDISVLRRVAFESAGCGSVVWFISSFPIANGELT